MKYWKCNEENVFGAQSAATGPTTRENSYFLEWLGKPHQAVPVTCAGWPYLGRGVGQNDLQRDDLHSSPNNSVRLWLSWNSACNFILASYFKKINK